jgi:anti-sigma factor RsiW
MKTFEEKWTAWLDDQLSGRELSQFEAALPDKSAAEAEKAESKKLRQLLKRELNAQPLVNEEFFSHQLREKLMRETASESLERSTRHGTGQKWWTVPRLLWAGAASLAVFMIFTFAVMHEKRPAEESQYLTQILNARVDPVVSPNATVSIFEAKQDRVTVLWTEGLQSLPADYAAK